MKAVPISIPLRIAAGFACLSLLVLLSALVLNMIPQPLAAAIDLRRTECATIAVSLSIDPKQDPADRVAATLDALVEFRPEILSAALRDRDGHLVAQSGQHQSLWRPAGVSAPGTQMSVPVRNSFQDGTQVQDGTQEQGDTLEVRYTDPAAGLWFGFPPQSFLSLLLFFGVASLLLSLTYLRILWPTIATSQTVPERVRSALDSLSGGLLVLDSQARIVMANTAFAEVVQIPPAGLRGRHVTEFGFRPADPESAQPYQWLRSIQEGKPQPPTMLTLDGLSPRTFLVNNAPIESEHDQQGCILASFDDVTELQRKELELKEMLEELTRSREEICRQNDELRELATSDPLTGCLNRRSFFEKYETEWSGAARYKHPISVIMLDLDHFKAINDNHGHAMGDLVLKKTATKLNKVIRNTDILARYGGEEFCILLPHVTIDGAVQAAERFRRAIAELKFPVDVRLTASMGVSSFSLGADSPHAMLEEADKCLFVAKRSGRDRVIRWDEVHEDVQIDESQLSRAEPLQRPSNLAIPFHAVTALLSALGYRDPATADHSRRVADLCVATASGLMTVNESYVLEVAALLHDIGKIGVPNAILLKPGPLTPEERQIMAMHDRIGWEIIDSAFTSPVLMEVVTNRQALFGGNGQDTELPVGQDIPLASRILTIANTFDELVTDQVYRPGCQPQAAFAELRRRAGDRFDPELVEHFIQVISDGNEG